MKIGIDIGGSHYAMGIVDEYGNIIKKIDEDIKISLENPFRKIVQTQIIKQIENLCEKEQIESIGLAVPGTILDDTIIVAENLNVYNYSILKDLQEKIKIPIKIENDANCATLAEYKYGNMKGYANALLIAIGTGIGGGMIINKNLFKSTHFPGMEIGHMVIHQGGKKCNCGNKGCLETYASMKAFKENIKKELNLPISVTGEDILKYIKQNTKNEKVTNIINEFISDLSTGISNLVNLLEPEIICIGGSFVHFEEIFLPKIKSKLLSSNMLFNKRNNIEIKCAKLGNDAGIIGSTLL